MSQINSDILNCSFCGKSQNEVFKLIAGPNVFICNECIELCKNIIKEESSKASNIEKLLKPKEIVNILNSYIIGQNHAKKVLAVAVYNHYKRLTDNKKSKDTESSGIAEKIDSTEIKKSNVLLVGPTGCGKTLLAQTLSKLLDVPFAIADATSLTESGYVGDDVETIILRLLHASGNKIELAETGIIYIDEIDKIIRKTDSPSITRDVSGEGVQQALLKIIEGTIAYVPPQGSRKHPQQECFKINTSNILFIVGGAFEGLNKVIKKRLDGNTIGFAADIKTEKEQSSEILAKIEPEDLIKYGLIPEFVGRFPVISVLDELNEDALIRILCEPKDALIKQYQSLFEIDGIKLTIEDNAIKTIANEALKTKAGARGLRNIMEKILLDYMFELPSDNNISKLHITDEIIKKQLSLTNAELIDNNAA